MTASGTAQSIGISIRAAAPLVGLSEDVLYDLAKAGKFWPAVRIGRRWVVHRDSVDAWLAEQAQAQRAAS